MAETPQHRIEVAGVAGGFSCRDGETVIAAMERAGWLGYGRDAGGRPIAIGCRRGGCGVCRVQVLAGQYRTNPMNRAHVSAIDQQQGYVLACCLIPHSDLRLLPAEPAGSAAVAVSGRAGIGRRRPDAAPA